MPGQPHQMRYLLENGLEGLDGVLFLDERDERVGKSEPRGRDGVCAAWKPLTFKFR